MPWRYLQGDAVALTRRTHERVWRSNLCPYRDAPARRPHKDDTANDAARLDQIDATITGLFARRAEPSLDGSDASHSRARTFRVKLLVCIDQHACE